MERSSTELARRYGTIITIASGVSAALFLLGIARRSYVALAVPVGALVLGGLGMAAWIGRLLMTTPEPPEEF